MHVLRWHKLTMAGDAFLARRVTKTWRQPVKLHGHDFAEVFWVDAGCGQHFINGRKALLKPGQVVVIRPSDRHAIEPKPKSSLQLTNIAFAAETFEFLCRRHFSDPMLGCWKGDTLPYSPQAEPDQLVRLNHWADLLSQAPQQKLALDRFLLNLVAELSPHPANALPNGTPDWLIEACQKVQSQEHFQNGGEALPRLAGRSREHVARCCRQFLSLTPTEYVNRIRMRYAARQLEMSSKSILEIALDCGIGNLSHFYGLFREQYEITPRAYRLSHRQLL